MTLRRIVFFLCALCVAAFPIALWAGIAEARVGGGCVVTVNGVDANTASTPSSAIKVSHDSTATVTGQAPFHVTSHDIDLEFAGFRWTASSGQDNGPSWSGSVNVKKYAKYGVGIYKVVGISNGAGGRSCSGAAFIEVTGKNALTTPVGAGAAGVTAVAIIGLAAATVRASSGKDLVDNAIDGYDTAMADRGSGGMTDEQAIKNIDREVRNASGGWFSLCLLAVPNALLGTMALMVSGAGAPGAPGALRVRWRPRISVVGLGSGLLGALGALILLQQFAVVYPTRTVTIVAIVIGLLVGILLPSLRRLSFVRRVNRRLAAAEARGSAGAQAPSGGPA